MSKILRTVPIVSLLFLAACSDEKIAKETAEEMGMTDVKTTGYSWFGCGKDDAFSTGFTAKAQNGSCVSGVVCSGWFKSATIRTAGRISCDKR